MIDFVLSLNSHRRHLSENKLTAAAMQAAAIRSKEVGKRNSKANLIPGNKAGLSIPPNGGIEKTSESSAEIVARAMGASPRKVERLEVARKVDAALGTTVVADYENEKIKTTNEANRVAKQLLADAGKANLIPGNKSGLSRPIDMGVEKIKETLPTDMGKVKQRADEMGKRNKGGDRKSENYQKSMPPNGGDDIRPERSSEIIAKQTGTPARTIERLSHAVRADEELGTNYMEQYESKEKSASAVEKEAKEARAKAGTYIPREIKPKELKLPVDWNGSSTESKYSQTVLGEYLSLPGIKSSAPTKNIKRRQLTPQSRGLALLRLNEYLEELKEFAKKKQRAPGGDKKSADYKKSVPLNLGEPIKPKTDKHSGEVTTKIAKEADTPRGTIEALKRINDSGETDIIESVQRRRELLAQKSTLRTAGRYGNSNLAKSATLKSNENLASEVGGYRRNDLADSATSSEKSNEDLASEVGMSNRTYRERVQIARLLYS